MIKFTDFTVCYYIFSESMAPQYRRPVSLFEQGALCCSVNFKGCSQCIDIKIEGEGKCKK